MTEHTNHPWFRPLWRRIVLVGLCAALAVWDLYHANYGWALIFGGLSGFATYLFFIAWKDESEPSDKSQ